MTVKPLQTANSGGRAWYPVTNDMHARCDSRLRRTDSADSATWDCPYNEMTQPSRRSSRPLCFGSYAPRWCCLSRHDDDLCSMREENSRMSVPVRAGQRRPGPIGDGRAGRRMTVKRSYLDL